MKVAMWISALALLASACTSGGSTGTTVSESGVSDLDGLEVVEELEVALLPAEEDWCNTQEGRAGGWLVADDRDLFNDDGAGAPVSIEQETRRLLEIVASEGTEGMALDELTQIDTFLRLPLPSALACRTAFEARDR